MCEREKQREEERVREMEREKQKKRHVIDVCTLLFALIEERERRTRREE